MRHLPMRPFVALSASLLCGCNLLFGLDAAEDRADGGTSNGTGGASGAGGVVTASSTTDVSSSSTATTSDAVGSTTGGGAGPTSSSSSGTGDGGGSATSASTGEGTSVGTGGAGGEGGSCGVVDETFADFEDFPDAPWECSGSCIAANGPDTNGYVAVLNVNSGTEHIRFPTTFELLAGDVVSFSATSRVTESPVSSATLSLRNEAGDVSDVSHALSLDAGPVMHASSSSVTVASAANDVYLFVHASSPDSGRFDVDDIRITVRRCD